MIVIADTTPLNYLILIDLTQILPTLFKHVIIPQAVLNELQAQQAPDKVHAWITHPPSWLSVQHVQQQDVTLAHLDPGEREVMTLAQELQADLLLLDERLGRQEAMDRGFTIAGTVGLLDRAGARSLIDVPTAVARLRQTNFRAAPRLLNALLDRYTP
jgi:predicted nucleic acid-binding protein